MASKIYANMTTSITEFRRNPVGVVAAGQGAPVAILNRNTPVFYCVPLEVYHEMMERLEAQDCELNATLNAAREVMDENATLLGGLAK